MTVLKEHKSDVFNWNTAQEDDMKIKESWVWKKLFWERLRHV